MTSEAEAMSLAGRIRNLAQLEEILARARDLGAPDHARVCASTNADMSMTLSIDVRIPDKKNGDKNDHEKEAD
jgi:hypothetical protein